MNRAYSVLEIKAVSEDERVITGIATTPSPDRMGDILEPLGAEFAAEIPALWQHNNHEPVGHVTLGKPTSKGIPFTIRMARTDEAGTLKDRLDEAWQSVKLRLVKAVSVGFRALEYALLEGGGIRFLKFEILELSLVTVPANADCTINSIKSIDTDQRAATGHSPTDEIDLSGAKKVPASPGASGPTKAALPVVSHSKAPKEAHMNVAEQIRQFEATRQAKAARMAEIMEKSATDGTTLDADQSEEYDGLEAEVKSVDAHLKRLRDLEKANASTARPVGAANDPESGSQGRSPSRVEVKVEKKLDAGIGVARVAKAIALGKLHGMSPVEFAKSMYGERNPVTSAVLKAAVPAGTTLPGSWAEDLVGDATALYADFVEFLRPTTILGKFGSGNIPALRTVPFRVPLIGQTGGGEGYWVGEGKPKPLTAFDFNRNTLEPLKVANIAVVSEEVIRDSSPAADVIIRDALAAALRERLDRDFINPAKAAAAGISPASITNGVTPIAATGTGDADDIRRDVRALMATFIAANNAPTSGVWIMSSITALALSLMVNTLGQPEFPGVTMAGGTFMGLPVIVSEYVPTATSGEPAVTTGFVALVNAQDIYFADNGDIRIDMSQEASLQMLDNPSSHDAGTGDGASELVSLWQTNCVGFRAERSLNWAKRRASGVALLSGVKWGG